MPVAAFTRECELIRLARTPLASSPLRAQPSARTDKPTAKALCRELGVRRLDVFGSAVGDAFDVMSSDVDVLVEFEDASGWRRPRKLSMRPDPRKYLWDALRAAERLDTFRQGKSFADYRSDDLLKSAVERQSDIVQDSRYRGVLFWIRTES